MKASLFIFFGLLIHSMLYAQSILDPNPSIAEGLIAKSSTVYPGVRDRPVSTTYIYSMVINSNNVRIFGDFYDAPLDFYEKLLFNKGDTVYIHYTTTQSQFTQMERDIIKENNNSSSVYWLKNEQKGNVTHIYFQARENSSRTAPTICVQWQQKHYGIEFKQHIDEKKAMP